MNPSINYYQILGLTTAATLPEIKKAFRKLAIRYHPDHNPDLAMADEKFAQLKEAYEILSDPKKRAAYHYARHVLHPNIMSKPLASSAEDLLQLSNKLYASIQASDPFRIDKDQLFFQLMDLVSDHNLAILQQQSGKLILHKIMTALTGSAKELSSAQLSALVEKIKPILDADPVISQIIKQFLRTHTQYALWTRYKVFVALLLTALFCTAVYFSGKK